MRKRAAPVRPPARRDDPGTQLVHAWADGRFYPTRAALVQEFVGMLQCEVQALLGEGVTYMQLDSLHYIIRLADPQYRQQVRQAGADPEEARQPSPSGERAESTGVKWHGRC